MRKALMIVGDVAEMQLVFDGSCCSSSGNSAELLALPISSHGIFRMVTCTAHKSTFDCATSPDLIACYGNIARVFSHSKMDKTVARYACHTTALRHVRGIEAALKHRADSEENLKDTIKDKVESMIC
jgi:hypothetical protein